VLPDIAGFPSNGDRVRQNETRSRRVRVFGFALPERPRFGRGDAVVLLIMAAVLYLGVRLAFGTPAVIRGPAITLAPAALPYYAALSLGRMAAAYVLSLAFSLVYGYAAARNRKAERVLLPLLDILQSVPILSFLPVVLLGLVAVLPQRAATETAAIVLIFTSQAWNLTFSFYQSLRTEPTELREVAAVFRFSPWLRLKKLELPFAALGLIWNSVMSWAGGWFFLMAAEIFTLGSRDFRLPGLGAYLQLAAWRGDTRALVMGLVTLVTVIVLLDQLVWRPLLAWAERFKVSLVEEDNPPTSWFLDSLRRSTLAAAFSRYLWRPAVAWLDRRLTRLGTAPEPGPPGTPPTAAAGRTRAFRVWLERVVIALAAVAVLYGAARAVWLVATLPPETWGRIAVGALATLGRVALAVTIGLLWTVPVGVLIGTSPRAAAVLQPVVQVLAAIPATALFPVLLLGLVNVRGGPNIAAVLLMLLGTQWYLLFNVIAGAASIPQDLKYTSELMRLGRRLKWRNLILPALVPYLVTGLITASGGAWNASIVAEYASFGGRTSRVVGLGALITSSTAAGDYALLLASTLVMIGLVVTINRAVWRRLYRLAEERYRLDQ